MDAKRLASHSSTMTLVNLSDNHDPQSGPATAGAKDNNDSSFFPSISRTSDMADYSIAPSPTSPSEVQAPTQSAPLVRASTSGSYHAKNALRRMTTHETGEFVEDQDGKAEDDGLHTHNEEHEHGHEEGDQEHLEQSHKTLRSEKGKEDNREQGKDEEAEIEGKKSGKKKFELQDQTNLLPTKQVIFVFVGLTCALFCSLLDQTM